MSLLTSLGLSPALPSTIIPNYGPTTLIFHFLFAYGVLSSRTLKQIYGLDHNGSPREDLTKYGEAAVTSGKITRAQLNMLRRNESAHANAVENYALLVAAVGMASLAGVSNVVINRACLTYTIARVVYGAVYILVESDTWSQARGICWWVGNLSCLTLLWKAGGLLGVVA
ncbi:hypothetical protein BDW59DRAFT_151912 [Aspergillus cavernicola]|uniref:MAPEG family-domain-containing protein n=1 Tax=Aspergillus cavernicola TaxID=176166 RepID=A0ABR4HVL7_9EURO